MMIFQSSLKLFALFAFASPSFLNAQTFSQINDSRHGDGIWFENSMGRDKLKYGNSMVICFEELVPGKRFPNAPRTTDARCSIYVTNDYDKVMLQYYAYVNPSSGNVEFGIARDGTYTPVSPEQRGKIPKSNLLEMHAKQWLESR